MARMWQERADYGHFFYRITNGESAADAYDRVSGFNESLWRSFGEEDFASVCVLVTHGLMTRVFLMKWYHFSVEYFEDLRNVNHCEFVVMRLNPENQKYVLQNQLRTWSELRRERANSRHELQSPVPVRKRWGACEDVEGGRGDDFARRQAARRQNTADLFGDFEIEGDKVVKGSGVQTSAKAGESKKTRDGDGSSALQDGPSSTADAPPGTRILSSVPDYLNAGRDGGGSRSGAASPNLGGSDEVDADAEAKEHMRKLPIRSLALALNNQLDTRVGGAGKERVRADALGDQSDAEDDEEEEKAKAAEEIFHAAVR